MKTRRHRRLLAEIQQGALDEGAPISGLLRKCVILGGEFRSAPLRT